MTPYVSYYHPGFAAASIRCALVAAAFRTACAPFPQLGDRTSRQYTSCALLRLLVRFQRALINKRPILRDLSDSAASEGSASFAMATRY